MIEVKGQYVLSVSISDIEDFISVTELVEFQIEESSGNIPPSFFMDFYSSNDKLITKLNEGFPLLVQFGETVNSIDNLELYISGFTELGDGDRKRYTLNGFASPPDYTISPKILLTNRGSGIATLKSLVSQTLTPVFNVDVSSDNQVWLQHNISDRMFFNQLISHSYSENSFFLSAYCADKKFVIKDARVEAGLKADKPDWVFSNIDTDSNAVPYNGDYPLTTQTGLLNSLVGYGRERIIYEIEKGNSSFVNQLPHPVVALTKELAKKVSIQKKFAGSFAQTGNMHPNYYKAYLNFLVNSVMLNAVTVELRFSDRYRRIRPLDWVIFKNDSKANRKDSNEYSSGFYVVSTVRRRISNLDLTTTVNLGRESFNRIKL